MIRSFADKNAPAAFLVLFCLITIFALIAPRAASFAPPVAGLVMALFYCAKGQWLRPRKGDLFFALTIPGLAALSALWAIDPPFALERGGKLLPMLFFGVLFIAAARDMRPGDITPRFVTILSLLYIVITAAIGLEIFWGMKFYRFVNDVPDAQPVSIVMMNRSVVVATAFLLPFLLLLRLSDLTSLRKKIFGSAMILALGFCLLQTQSQSAQLFIILSVLFAAFFPMRLRATWIALGAGVCVLAFAAPWIAQFMFSAMPTSPEVLQNGVMRAASIMPRMQLWDFIAREALENPLYGQGIEATRFLKSDQWMEYLMADNMLHPHNAVLQLWVEFGVIGVTLGCALFVTVLMRIWHLPLPARRVGLGTLIATLAVLSSGYGLWQSWQIGLLLALFALMTIVACVAGDKNLVKQA